MKTIVGIATIEERKESLADTINSLYDQVDEICIYYDDYRSEIFGSEKIETIGGFKKRELGDAGKFARFFGNAEDAYYLTCDDDLIYPPDYVKAIKESIDGNPDCVYSSHGKVYFPDPDKGIGYYQGFQYAEA